MTRLSKGEGVESGPLPLFHPKFNLKGSAMDYDKTNRIDAYRIDLDGIMETAMSILVAEHYLMPALFIQGDDDKQGVTVVGIADPEGDGFDTPAKRAEIMYNIGKNLGKELKAVRIAFVVDAYERLVNLSEGENEATTFDSDHLTNLGDPLDDPRSVDVIFVTEYTKEGPVRSLRAYYHKIPTLEDGLQITIEPPHEVGTMLISDVIMSFWEGMNYKEEPDAKGT